MIKFCLRSAYKLCINYKALSECVADAKVFNSVRKLNQMTGVSVIKAKQVFKFSEQLEFVNEVKTIMLDCCMHYIYLILLAT